MRIRLSTRVLTALALLAPALAGAQNGTSTSAAVRDELLAQFNVSMRKFIALAEVMPADKFSWKPEREAMEVGHVYAHVAHYNFYYPASAMGVAAPANMKTDTLEAMRDKAQLVQLLRTSAEHVRASVSRMSAEQLERPTKLYGREVAHWAVLVQLVAHMNEHLGQSIAYARSNNIVPPWSR
jgi:uncharacterized damage-inducible protein DinB